MTEPGLQAGSPPSPSPTQICEDTKFCASCSERSGSVAATAAAISTDAMAVSSAVTGNVCPALRPAR